MNKVCPFPDRKAIAETAVEWLVKFDGDNPPTAAELAEFREWLSRSPQHWEEVNNLNAFWSNNILTELMVPLGKYREHERSKGRSRRMRSFLPAAIAAVLILAFVFTFGTVLISPPLEATNGLYVTAVGQQQSITLADGSVLQLNTNSQVKVDYNQQHRNVLLLQGEVHFDVAKKPKLPFRVYGGGGRVQAVGTAFTVYLKNKDMDVLVTEGRVAVATLNNRDSTHPAATGNSADAQSMSDFAAQFEVQDYLEVDEGQGVTVKVADNLTDSGQLSLDMVKTIDQDELTRRQSWREGLLVFSGEPLSEVIDQVGRYTTVTIEIADPAVGAIQIGGRFKAGNVEAMLAALEANFGLQVTKLNYDRVLLSAAQ
jgi:transmembrane sensor